MLYDQWKFAFISMNRPDYLQDSDVVSARFQVNYCLFPTGFSSCAHKFVVFYDLQSFLFWFLQRRDVYGAWEQYLGLEHADTAPKRAYTANQVCCCLVVNLWSEHSEFLCLLLLPLFCHSAWAYLCYTSFILLPALQLVYTVVFLAIFLNFHQMIFQNIWARLMF